ncbi:MAG: polysaccharide deacetylase family protein [Flavobacteriales bacterium]|nr:polysaccharide deacetylase family protein [Flavobacteriales bacterium]
MSLYLKKIPKILYLTFPKALWSVSTNKKVLYLSFDDGPNEGVTDFVLEQLEKYNAKATFFCLGENVNRNESLFSEISKRGHSVGNHGYSHLNGFSTDNSCYFRDVEKADKLIKTDLFRPPYGKIKPSQYKLLSEKYRIVFWSIMPGDFDESLDGNRCYKNVVDNAENGSIIVFHDSIKAFPRLKIALPKVLEYYTKKGYAFDKIQ